MRRRNDAEAEDIEGSVFSMLKYLENLLKFGRPSAAWWCFRELGSAAKGSPIFGVLLAARGRH